MTIRDYIRESFKRGFVQIVRRPMYALMMLIMPVAGALFLLSLMSEGAIRQVPVGIVDLDQSSMSRQLGRTLKSFPQVNVSRDYKDFSSARAAVQRGEIMGFYLIPPELEDRALGGRQPVVSYYVNYAYIAAASMQFKGFKTISLLANGGIAQVALRKVGLRPEAISATLQPYVAHTYSPGNPWLNYNYYLCLSFVPCLFALFVLLVTAFSLGTELKNGLCRQWLKVAGDNMVLALTGKLLPQTVVFTAVGWFIQWLMYCVYHLPLNCSPWHMLLAMPLFVMANQGFAVTLFCITPNFRYGSTLCSLLGMLSFSFCAFSLPEEAMYPWVQSLGYTVPVKYYFLLSIDQALNGISLYYSRVYYAMLGLFILLPLLLTWRLKKECKNPVYVP